MHIYEQFGVRPIINARSFSTKLGGAALPKQVLDAMREAAACCVRMDELQDAASRVIAEATGAEAGIVTSGASAALTLAAAACIAGMDASRMNRLPDTAGLPNEIVVHRSHRNDYDHALRAAGARFVEVGFSYYTFPYEIEEAITEQTAALFYQAGGDGSVIPLSDFAAIAHKRGKPVIVDAAAELPPRRRLRSYIEEGADLVAFSGGKHIRGPQASGILCGRSDLILSAALQHQDMDVFPSTWPLRRLMAEGRIAGPPHHGIGRGFKAGKEEIIGLMVALRRYSERDRDAESRQWHSDMECIVSSIQGLLGVSAYVRLPQANGREVPHAVIQIDPTRARMTADAAVNELQEGAPPIYVFEHGADAGTIVCMPEALNPGEAAIIGKRLREILEAKD
ncbi:MAG TPA: aminotransferase class V-fold PLP-dependent enzyme [Bryobacteraceae bacterium]|jgi:L-seryl-tRNA(Ser) seleniumtransferase